jgi:type VII secretion integral membrane protein EccD
VDIALPAQVPFAELFPTVARYCGLDQNDLLREPGGWVLQRLGQPPFGPAATPASEGLYDGELVYLRPKSVEMPPVAADDIADEIASVHEGAGRWVAADAQRLAIGAGAVALLGGAAILVRSGSGSGWTLPAVVAGAMAVILLGAAAAASRAAGNRSVAVLLGSAAVPYAFLAGIAGVTATLHGNVSGAGHQLQNAGALGAAAGFSLAMVAAVVAAAVIAHGVQVFFGVAVAALFGLGAAGIAYADPSATLAGAAALVASPALALTPAIPAVAFRIARLSMPPVPISAEDLRNDALTAPQADVRSRAIVADRAVTGAACGIGLVGGGAEIALGFGHGLLVMLTAVVLACVMLLLSRIFRGRAQRLWLLIPGYAGLAWTGAAATHVVGASVPVVVLALLAGTGLILGVGSWLPGHRPSPFWGRAADVLDTLAIVSLIPLALGVADVLGFLHGLSG